MNGDFSQWPRDPSSTDQGVLFQQGRVISDADLTAGERIALGWRLHAAQDVIGAGVAAVPAAAAGGFHIEAAFVAGGVVHLRVAAGRLWADGIALELPGEPGQPLERIAPYLEPPANPPGTDASQLGDGVRDAVILEVALEAFNGFQAPARLIEPALGGPDTAERIVARYGFRLLRLGAGEDCRNIGARLADGPAGKGRLTVTLQPTVVVPGECPVVAGGGYTGFEHNLYRIEIAACSDGVARFKWSPFNGGLVGRGVFDASGAPRRVQITANRTAILSCGQDAFYLEALQLDPALGHWRVVYGAFATLDAAQDLVLGEPPVFGSFPAVANPGDSVFFRLWHGLEAVADYPAAGSPVELRDGIRLQFDTPGATAGYRPGDAWSFSVRAGEIANPQTLIDTAPPQELTLHRVPLAEIGWSARLDTRLSGTLEDCRRRFRPLVEQRVCCTWLVGDGLTSFGDFNSLEEAAAHLPAAGGELCLLPGTHFANLALSGARNLRIHGCPRQTRVLARPASVTAPILSFSDCSAIAVSGLDLIALGGDALLAAGSQPGALHGLSLCDCRVLAHDYGVRVDNARDVSLADNRIWVLDTSAGRCAISLRAEEARIERNRLGVWPFSVRPPGGDGGDGGSPDPTDPCASPERLYARLPRLLTYAEFIWAGVRVAAIEPPYRALGGIHLRGACDGVHVLENDIDGGAGHGITLGGLLPGEAVPATDNDNQPLPSVTLTQRVFRALVQDGDGQPLAGVDVFLGNAAAIVAQDSSDAQGLVEMIVPAASYRLAVAPAWRIAELRESSAGGDGEVPFFVLVLRAAVVQTPADRAFLYRLLIEGNTIHRMALSGIGFRPFAELAETPPAEAADTPALLAALLAALAPRELIGRCNVVHELLIRGNRIEGNLRAVFDAALLSAARSVGQGGISLALVERVTIADNRIHDNGRSANDPVCGVFIGFGEDIELSGNHIADNGALGADYAQARQPGLRGGVVVRLAAASLSGGSADVGAAPALRVRDNRIDQPAGRALSALAFGPLAVLGNSLNSEAEGRLNSLDTLVGSVLLIDVGGLHRQLGLAPSLGSAPVAELDNAAATVSLSSAGSFVDRARLEQALPGGELLFDDNQVRMGPRSRAALSLVLASLDDVGCGGNQSSVFRPDLLFANGLLFGYTLRASAGRWREAARACWFSLLSYAAGLNSAANAFCMNTTAHNQGDHCIVAASAGSASGLPVIDDGNLEANRGFCRRIAAEPASLLRYLLQGLVAVLAQQQSNASNSRGNVLQSGTLQTVGGVQSAYTQLQYARSLETARLSARYGASDARVQAATTRLAQARSTLNLLDVQQELATITPAAVPDAGLLLDGRIADTAGRGREGLSVQLVRADGSVLDGFSARTDASGYYAMTLDAGQAAQLRADSGLRLQVADAQNRVLARSEQVLSAGSDPALRASLSLPKSALSRADANTATVIFEGTAPTPHGLRLEDIRGIGPVIAARLRAAGIADVDALLQTDTATLVRLAGLDAEVLRREAARAQAASTTPQSSRSKKR
ncbi:helix-hairpin-helix domain-containing protein [Plasticicumulans acidivorans]|uniref:Parallel beta helix pectate lyase-like protein n=1 Tax=Plasticicumulans acidivorans TaxID=886464 RepID=A0A317MZM0_9GAMM|nr:helix-hairpin-helix domain-containing protein [Plasticicumulans acidivorans]PWV61192.1 parallel beta helix pectate lyase-like protein [Plasticicumulans acidivorans]